MHTEHRDNRHTSRLNLFTSALCSVVDDSCFGYCERNDKIHVISRSNFSIDKCNMLH